MIHIFALLLFTLHVASSQVIPFTPNNGVVAGTVPGHLLNSHAVPVNNVGTNGNFANALAANKAMSERISHGLENQAVANTLQANDPTLNLENLASNSLSGLSGNVATFNLGGDGTAFTITSGSPGSQGFGIQVQADALEVGGTVSVNGQIPIYGTVSVNGNVPTDGTAAVNYNCGSQAAPAVTAIL